MLHIRLEKIRFLVMEMRLVLRLVQAAPTDEVARIIARHIFVRLENFIQHARQLKKFLNTSGYNTNHYHKIKEEYVKLFEDYSKKIRNHLSAHIQDLDLREILVFWYFIDEEKLSIFVELAAKIYSSLENLGIVGFPILKDFPEINEPVFKETLLDWEGSGEKSNGFEVARDPFSRARPDTLSIGNYDFPLINRAQQIYFLYRWITIQKEVYEKFKGFANVVRIIKSRIITDVVSSIDCLVTRDIDPSRPQYLEGFDKLFKKCFPENPLEEFKKEFSIENIVAPYRDVRNKFGAHFEKSVSYSLIDLKKLIDESDLNLALKEYETLIFIFDNLCKYHRNLYIYCPSMSFYIDDPNIIDLISKTNKNYTFPFHKSS
ncbi:hypothetical protein E3E11_07610 [Oecophyllibacter saccharovorans]|uniref:hypothetical protein n=1 Tax=Oecophyllibacter saccharovorans TaxID=2558360 RepID=UPI0011431E54|nr:hypothetical protein [Oecophyllibacter saccharovorans]QDH15735.1 hypothetical protein E3E11_07610 [Oecophyllibacter saccharovorans]